MLGLLLLELCHGMINPFLGNVGCLHSLTRIKRGRSAVLEGNRMYKEKKKR